jgi:hypothetical protein
MPSRYWRTVAGSAVLREGRIMRLFLSGCLLIAFSAGPSTAQMAEDPGGWTKAKWGMTAAQLKQAFPQAVVYNSGRSGQTFDIPEDEINGEKVHVSFEVGAEGLRRVLIEPDAKSPVDSNLESPPPTVARIGQILLLAGLQDQFGEPTASTTEPSFDETGQMIRQWRWSFPATTVLLVRKSHGDPAFQDLDRTYLVYEKANAGF